MEHAGYGYELSVDLSDDVSPWRNFIAFAFKVFIRPVILAVDLLRQEA